MGGMEGNVTRKSGTCWRAESDVCYFKNVSWYLTILFLK